MISLSYGPSPCSILASPTIWYIRKRLSNSSLGKRHITNNLPSRTWPKTIALPAQQSIVYSQHHCRFRLAASATRLYIYIYIDDSFHVRPFLNLTSKVWGESSSNGRAIDTTQDPNHTASYYTIYMLSSQCMEHTYTYKYNTLARWTVELTWVIGLCVCLVFLPSTVSAPASTYDAITSSGPH